MRHAKTLNCCLYVFAATGLRSSSPRIHEYQHAYTPPHINRTYRALTEIAEGFIQQTPLYEEIISSHIHTILSDLLTLQHGPKAGRESVIDQSIHYIEANYYLPLTVQELAGMACLNASYFFREVQKPDRNHTKAISDTDTAERSKNTAQRYGLEHKGNC